MRKFPKCKYEIAQERRRKAQAVSKHSLSIADTDTMNTVLHLIGDDNHELLYKQASKIVD